MSAMVNTPGATASKGGVEAPGGSARFTAMEAIVQLLLDQHELDERRGFHTGGLATGYPGSPLGGLQGMLEKNDARLKSAGVHQTPGLNEELAATALWGSQTVTELPGATVDGVYGLWYGKAPGVDRAADALRHANMRGTHPRGGVLVLAGDDPNANATVFPTDSTSAFQAWGMPVLYPGSVQEVLDLGHHGYELSRIAGLWVGVKLVTTVADASGSVRTDLDRLTMLTPTVEVEGRPFHPTLRAKDPGAPMREAERDLIGGRRRLAEKYIELNQLNPVVVDPDRATIGILAPGKTYFDLRRGLDTLGLDDDALLSAGIRIKKVSALFPIGVDEWRVFARGLDEVIVVEEKQPFLETALKNALYGSPDQPQISGKADPAGLELFPSHGEFGPDLVARVLGRRLVQLGVVLESSTPPPNTRSLLPILSMDTARQGFFCSGCPHNSSLKAPDGAVVGAGIGCHIMSLMVDRDEYGDQTGFTQMGGEGAQWVGQSPFTTLPHIFQNVGDGTFHHSASLALRLAVANDVNITYKLLYNSAVGMTGGQDVKGGMTVPELTRSLLAEGVSKIIVTTEEPKRHRRSGLPKGVSVRHRDDLIEVQEELSAIGGVTVLIHDQQCAAERRRRWSRGEQEKPTKRIVVNERVCEGCGDCNDKSQCLSVQPVETAFGRKTHIHQSSCNLDFSCVKGDCPSFMTVDVTKATKARKVVPEPPKVGDPVRIVKPEHFTAHMTGVGGTGVVSANAILARAAALDGLRVRSLDLPGGTIKAGTVVSQMQVYVDGEREPAATVGPGEADLFLGFDMLGAMTQANLEPLSPERTVVVAASSIEPTGDMAIDPSIPLPESRAVIDELRARSRADVSVYVDVAAICDAVFGSQGSANALLMGAAFQAGALPFTAGSMLEAFRDAGVAVESNIAAFGWGRAAVAKPALIAELGLSERPVGGGAVSPELTELVAPLESAPDVRDLVIHRAEDLMGYQGAAHARVYVQRVIGVLRAEQAALGDGASSIALGYAHGLHKLTAYKDEYEVARLLLLDSAKQAVTAEFGDNATISWNLHPPILRALGMDRKITLGPWFRPGFVLLRSMRRLRGTVFDVFGLAAVRRLERMLVAEYVTMMDRALAVVSPTNAASVRELAVTPELVRGYEFVKVRRTRDYVATVDRLVSQVGADYAVPDELTSLIEKASDQS